MDEKFHKRRGDYEEYYDSYNYGGYNCRRSSQTLGTTSRPLSFNNLKLPILCGTFGPYDNKAQGEWKLNQSKTWSLMKQSLRNRLELETMKDKDKVKQRKNSWNLQRMKVYKTI
ncbi:hypothetical protein M9H77_12988 [Catharanthus roseus]|uniref:Uncharacterized protein n=1 Tax=Catharanthus roseus TaxID=4058 RepID=A0ACC0BJ55_CATRO|nr:hypothetical protein M9H77_12988 [Catharanthus roseus]